MPSIEPARGLDETEGVAALEGEFMWAARRTWQQLPAADVAAAVEAGMHAEALTSADIIVQQEHPTDGGNHEATGTGRAMAAEMGAAAAAIQRQGLPASTTAPVNWSAFGTVIPVLAGSPGAGASVLTVLLADALQLEQRSVLMVDPSDPPRSGLAAAVRSDGPGLARPHPQIHIRFSWRAQALVARLETVLPIVAPGMVPPPRFWRPPVGELHVTVVDLGHDPWRVAAHPLTGAGEWLRRGTPPPHPILVVRPTRPSLLHAEQVLVRLDSWITLGVVAPPRQLVVMGAKRWPAGVVGAAGRRLSPLLSTAVFVPYDSDISTAGVTAAVTPARLRQVLTPLLRRWNLLPEPARKSKRADKVRRS